LKTKVDPFGGGGRTANRSFQKNADVTTYCEVLVVSRVPLKYGNARAFFDICVSFLSVDVDFSLSVSDTLKTDILATALVWTEPKN